MYDPSYPRYPLPYGPPRAPQVTGDTFWRQVAEQASGRQVPAVQVTEIDGPGWSPGPLALPPPQATPYYAPMPYQPPQPTQRVVYMVPRRVSYAHAPIAGQPTQPTLGKWTVPIVCLMLLVFVYVGITSVGETVPIQHTANHQAKPAFSGVIGASAALVRINQLDAAQYASAQEYNTWAYSTCSAASMTEIINAYNAYHHTGKQYRITDILKVEAGIGAISSDLGLLEPTGIDRTMTHYNFTVTWLKNPSLDEVINTANTGRPVMVNFPPDRWSGGHLLVVRGGNRDYVYLADSSRLNMQAMAHQTFMKYWAGFAAVPEPVA